MAVSIKEKIERLGAIVVIKAYDKNENIIDSYEYKEKIKPIKTKNINNKMKKPFYKRWWFILLIIILLIGVIGNKDTEPTTTKSSEIEENQAEGTLDNEKSVETVTEVKLDPSIVLIMDKTTLSEEESILAFEIIKSVGFGNVSNIEDGMGTTIDELLSFRFICDGYINQSDKPCVFR